MERRELLKLYDRERQRPPADRSVRCERIGRVTRVVGAYNCIVHSDLDVPSASAAVAEQTAYFRAQGRSVEWKVYGHDRPAGLGRRLRAAGFVAGPSETLMVLDLHDSLFEEPEAPEVSVQRVVGRRGLRAAVAVSRAAFGPGEGWPTRTILRRLADPGLAIYLAYLSEVPVAAARLEMPRGSLFASLWGGGTRPEYRRRGAYRALVTARAEEARRQGYRFLTVDARPTSRPILERIGFRALTSIIGWILPGRAPTVGPVRRIGSGRGPPRAGPRRAAARQLRPGPVVRRRRVP